MALTTRSSSFLSFSASRLRYQPELCSLPQLYGVSKSLPASKLQHSAHRPHSVGLPAWKSQSLLWQDSPHSRHFKTAQLFSCYSWKLKRMRSACHQQHLSVLWQDLFKELQGFAAKAESGSLSDESICLPLASRADPRNCCYQENMLYSILSQAFSSFLWIQLSTSGRHMQHEGRLVGVSVPPSTPTAGKQQRKSHTRLHKVINWLAH